MQRRLVSDRSQRASALRQAERRPLIAVLENIRSMGNVGSMFRTADAMALQRILLCGFTAHPPRAEIEKTALGTTESVPWEYWTHAPQAVRWLRAEGYRILALERCAGARTLNEIRLSEPTALVVGHETDGISPATLALCDEMVAIAMHGLKDSLNVAVAFGIAAHALAEQLPAPPRLR
jgi:tRNA G18 (ribose-2'-O)-methylase SpoU